MKNSVSAAGKAILLGEHAVVYGSPAIAIPLSQIRAHAKIVASDQPLTIVASDLAGREIRLDAVSAASTDPLANMAALTLNHFGLQTMCGEISIESDIPIAGGLGSGAAVSAALGRAIAAFHGRDIPLKTLNAMVYEVEKLHHGTPSGIDNTVVVYEKPVYFVRGQSQEFIQIKSPIHIVLADTGIASLTRQAVADVQALHRQCPEKIRATIDEIGAVVESARRCIEVGDMPRLGELMTANHTLLQTLTVSLPELDNLVVAAMSAGALGAKLSGGGRGGNIIALVNEDRLAEVRSKLLEAGAARVFVTTAGSSGVTG